jgi:hypothetical protein
MSSRECALSELGLPLRFALPRSHVTKDVTPIYLFTNSPIYLELLTSGVSTDANICL